MYAVFTKLWNSVVWWTQSATKIWQSWACSQKIWAVFTLASHWFPSASVSVFFFFFFLNKRKRLGLVDAGGPCWVCRSCPQCQVLGSIPCCLFRQNVRIITADNLVSFPNIFSLFDFSLSEDLQMGPSPTFFREHFLLSFVLTSKHTRGKSLSWPHDPAFVHHSSH